MGTQILYDSGYDPSAMAQFFQKIQAEDGSDARWSSSATTQTLTTVSSESTRRLTCSVGHCAVTRLIPGVPGDQALCHVTSGASAESQYTKFDG